MNATKVFNTIEGGLITFKDESLLMKLELIKYYGMESSEDITYIGSNLKMNEFQAAMGLCNLPLLDKEIGLRKKNAEVYIKELSMIEVLLYLSIVMKLIITIFTFQFLFIQQNLVIKYLII